MKGRSLLSCILNAAALVVAAAVAPAVSFAYFRGTDRTVEHRPKTYETQDIDGVLSFKDYDQKLVVDCDPSDVNKTCLDISIGTFYNDLWRYRLGSA